MSQWGLSPSMSAYDLSCPVLFGFYETSGRCGHIHYTTGNTHKVHTRATYTSLLQREIIGSLKHYRGWDWRATTHTLTHTHTIV